MLVSKSERKPVANLFIFGDKDMQIDHYKTKVDVGYGLQTYLMPFDPEEDDYSATIKYLTDCAHFIVGTDARDFIEETYGRIDDRTFSRRGPILYRFTFNLLYSYLLEDIQVHPYLYVKANPSFKAGIFDEGDSKKLSMDYQIHVTDTRFTRPSQKKIIVSIVAGDTDIDNHFVTAVNCLKMCLDNFRTSYGFKRSYAKRCIDHLHLNLDEGYEHNSIMDVSQYI